MSNFNEKQAKQRSEEKPEPPPPDYPYDNTTAILEEEYRDRKQVLSELAALNENIKELNKTIDHWCQAFFNNK